MRRPDSSPSRPSPRTTTTTASGRAQTLHGRGRSRADSSALSLQRGRVRSMAQELQARVEALPARTEGQTGSSPAHRMAEVPGWRVESGIEKLNGQERDRLRARQRRRQRPPGSSARSNKAITRAAGRRGQAIVEEEAEGDLCARGQPLRRCQSLARPGVPDRQRSHAQSRPRRIGRSTSSSPACNRAVKQDSRRRRHKPLDDERPFSALLPRAHGYHLLPAHGLHRLRARACHRGLPLEALLSHLRRPPRGKRPVHLLLPRSACRVFRAGGRRRGRLGRRQQDPLHGQQLRDTAHVRCLRAHSQQASGADAVPVEERPPPHVHERGGGG